MSIFIIGKSITQSLRNLTLKHISEERKPILKQRLGFNSIDEYMRAMPEEIRRR